MLIFLYSCVGPKAHAQEYLFSYIGEKDGLNEQNINSIQQDRKGYIWIATHNALQRYDGQRFLTFHSKRNQPGAIPRSGIRSLLIDKKNRLWMITGNTMVGYFDVDRFIFHEVPIQYSKDVLEKSGACLYSDIDGNLMMVLQGKAILTYNEATNEMAEKYNRTSLPAGWKINHIWQQPSSRVYWMGCDSGLAKFNPITRQLSYRGHNAEQDPYISQFEKANSIVNVYIDHSRRLWITYWPSTGMFIKSFRPGEKESHNWRDEIDHALNGRYFEMQGVTELKDGTLWMSGANLLAKLNERSGRIEIIRSNASGEYSIRYDRINPIMQDREKNIWIGTDKGLFRFNPSAQIFKSFNNRQPGKDSIFTADVTDILQTSAGEILVSTWGTGVFAYDKYFNPLSSRIVTRNFSKEEAMIWCMLQTKNGDIWRGSQGGYLYIYHASTGQTEKLQPAEFENSTIRQLEEDKKGNMWFGTQRGFLIKQDAHSKKFSVIQKFKSIISRIRVDTRGNLWVCTATAGLYQLDDDGKIINTYTTDGGKTALLSNGCADVIQYNDSLYCIANDGLSILNIHNKTMRHLTMEEGLPSTNITNIVKDGEGFIWMTSASGIISFNPLNGKLSAWNSTDGIHTNAFSLAGSGRLNDGRIVFGTNHDLLVFDPRAAGTTITEIAKVEITGISVQNTALNADSVSRLPELKLSYRQNSLLFQLSTLSYQNIFTVYYKMENIDKEWKVADKSKTAVYNYLPPGEYTLQVACKKADGTFGPMNTLKIKIAAPFWKTWWFYGTLALLALLIIYWLDKQRISRMRREQEIRSSIAGNLHQEVNTTLQNINVLSEIAGMKADKHPEQSKDYIHEIKQKSRNMVTALNDVLWSIDPANDSMEKNIDRMRELAESLSNTYNADMELQVDDNVKRLNLDMKKRHEFISIYKLGITTLIEQLGATHTSIHLDYMKGFLNLTIYSRSSNIYKGSNAVVRNINEMRERAASVGASLDIQSDDRNTSIILGIKV